MSTVVVPKFEQIKRQLVADIRSGRLSPGSRIPSETELMHLHGVARMTVVRSLNELRSEGYLVRQAGRGTFVNDALTGAGSGRKLSVFALIMPELRDGFCPSLIKGFSDAATHLNHQVLVCSSDDEVAKQGDTILQLIDNGVAGVTLLPTSHETFPIHHVRQLQSNGIPVVLLHRGVDGVSAPILKLEYEEIGRMAGRALAEAGHRRVALFRANESPVINSYAVGLREVLSEVGGEIPESLYHCGSRYGEKVTREHEQGIEQALVRMLALPEHQRPTAIFSSWDADAELIYLSLKKLGKRVPDDVAIVGFGGAWRGNALARILTSVTVDEEYAGRTAAGLLEEMSAGRRPIDDAYRSSIPLGLHLGDTLKPSMKEHGVLESVS
jgi:DNA-binding LacI/PurR family transcriptional regulator